MDFKHQERFLLIYRKTFRKLNESKSQKSGSDVKFGW